MKTEARGIPLIPILEQDGIVDGLQNDLERFSEGRGQELDRTMVLLRYFG